MSPCARSLVVAAICVLGAGHAAADSVPCVNGFAAGYPCGNVDLLAHMPFTAVGGTATSTGNDVWGWTDPLTGREYAILGLSNAASFVDISDPVHPVYVGRLLAPPEPPASCVPGVGPGAAPSHECSDPGPDDVGHAPEHCAGNSLWRDHEVYGNYLFVGSEQGNHGLVVFDLTRLRGATPGTEFTQDARYCGYGNSHTTTINTTTGFLYANGTRSGLCGGSGGPQIVDIRDPLVPVFAGCDSADGYTHDSQCFVYHGPDVAHQGKSICIDSNGVQNPSTANRLVIKDVTNPAAPVRLSSTYYAGAGYTHQGWITADHRYFLLDDELDEAHLGGNTKTYIWDLLDLDAPQLIGTHIGPTAAIDHQQFIFGNFAYQSNYRAGLRILETKDIASGVLTEVAKFDVYPPDDITDYGGTWANYPFYSSGVVALTSMGPPYGSLPGEFFVVRPLFADLALTVTGAPNPVVVGQNVTYTFTVRNQGPTYATNPTLTTRPNAGLTLLSVTPSQGTCSVVRQITCNLGRLDNAASATVTLVARVDVPGMFTGPGRAVVSNAAETDTRLGDNAATARTAVVSQVQAARKVRSAR